MNLKGKPYTVNNSTHKYEANYVQRQLCLLLNMINTYNTSLSTFYLLILIQIKDDNHYELHNDNKITRSTTPIIVIYIHIGIDIINQIHTKSHVLHI